MQVATSLCTSPASQFDRNYYNFHKSYLYPTSDKNITINSIPSDWLCLAVNLLVRSIQNTCHDQKMYLVMEKNTTVDSAYKEPVMVVALGTTDGVLAPGPHFM